MAKLPRKNRLGSRMDEALRYALELHRKQARKGKPVPYAAHLLGVAGTVLDFGGDEDQAIAALLHDAPEDCGGRRRLRDVRERFGRDVARMVRDCTDTFDDPKPPWRPRKEAYIASLPGKPVRSLLVSTADKLNNARAVVADLRADGPGSLDRFKGGLDTVWYFEELVRTLRPLGVGPIVDELAVAVDEMARLALTRPAGAAPRRRTR